MTGSPGPEEVYQILYTMEGEVLDVERWAALVRDLGMVENYVNPAGLYAVGAELERVAQSLRDQWNQAFATARTASGRAAP